MKYFGVVISLILFNLATTCNNNSKTENLIEITGKIEAIGMTSWQYGTHTISEGETFYALKSEKVNLVDYEGQEVTISARKIEGYPVDSGPEFLEVEKVKE